MRLKNARREAAKLPSDYFRGLNFLLNEQPDKAIEVFIKVLEVDSETVEMHLALGNLFRRRGEVERATRIHQNLIARPNLNRHQRSQALFELGQDYFKAGLLDRAEKLFLELSEGSYLNHQADRLLLPIYEQEKEWRRAIEIAEQVARKSDPALRKVVAHYFCELAELAISDASYELARKCLSDALGHDPKNVRATILLGRVESICGNTRKAIKVWRRVETQDARYIGEVVDLVCEAYRILDDVEGVEKYLKNVSEVSDQPKVALSLVRLLKSRDRDEQAEQFVIAWLEKQPSAEAVQQLLKLKLGHPGVQQAEFPLILNALEKIVVRRRPYLCGRCGFTGRSIYWQCPSCKGWGVIEPRDRIA